MKLIVRISHALNYLMHDGNQFMDSIVSNCFKWLPDRMYLQLRYRYQMGFWPNLKKPKRFSEKLQWLKLYDRNPNYIKLVDKSTVKEYVAGIIGDEYIVPTLGVWDCFDQIDWDRLPDQFVLKTTAGGGHTGVVICKSKNNFDKDYARKVLEESFALDIYKYLKEWPYKNVPQRIIAEEYIQTETDLKDYKFFCFNGIPQYCQVIGERSQEMCIDFFDMEWNHMPFHEPRNTKYSQVEIVKPKNYEMMADLARKLAPNKSFCRIDFYNVGGRILFGEVTFFPTSGFGGFAPDEWDEKFGSLVPLPLEKLKA